MQLTGIHHLTAISADLERTIAFYRDLLGLPIVHDGTSDDDPNTRHVWFGALHGGAGMLLSFMQYPELPKGTVGVGSTQHLAGEWFSALTGVQMTHVPYRSGSATMSDLLGGQIDVAFDTITVIEPQFRAGKAHVLGVTSGTRWWSTPDVAPVADAVPGYDVRTWVGMAAPKGLPGPVLKRLNEAVGSALADPAVADRLRKTGGMDVRASSPEEMRTMVAGQVARWKKVVADANIPQQ